MLNLALNLAHYVFCDVHSNRIFSKRNGLKNINFPELTEVLNELIFGLVTKQLVYFWLYHLG